jgi:Pyruvate/2-oxoacid:ferredoxin oxidoreductase delta subunit
MIDNAAVTTGSGPAPAPRIKKIAPELRRRKIRFSDEPNVVRRFLWRLRDDSQFLRSTLQVTFVLLCIWIGVEFYFFVQWGLTGGSSAYVARPPGVEGFLPISALISLKYWFASGTVNDVHPSGLFILLAIAGVSLVAKKAFCSWLCPVGTLSESLWMLGQRIFGRNFRAPRWLDYPLRSLKYLLLLFFGYFIMQMDAGDLAAFIYSPYNKVADVKMYFFFSQMTAFALWTIIVLMLFSIFVKNFWCRFLCPYGALLGIIGFVSPLKVTRNAQSCVDCNLCTKACPSDIAVHAAKRVWSDECTGCLACVAACPVRDTLEVRSAVTRTKIPAWAFGTLVAAIFMAVTGAALLTGHWQNAISRQEYQKRILQIDSPLYRHNYGRVPEYNPND